MPEYLRSVENPHFSQKAREMGHPRIFQSFFGAPQPHAHSGRRRTTDGTPFTEFLEPPR